MSINKLTVRRHFDRHAAAYEQYAVVQREMAIECASQLEAWVQECTCNGESIDSDVEPLRILEIGSGTGLLTKRLLRSNLQPLQHAQLTVLDLSERMMAELLASEEAVCNAHRLRSVVIDAEEWARTALHPQSNRAPIQFDLIVSCAAFQWFNDPQQTYQSLLKRLKPGGAIVYATFGPRTFAELHHAFALAEDQLGCIRESHGQTFPAAEQWKEWSGSAEELRIYESDTVMLYKDVMSFLHSVKRTGASNALREQAAGRMGKRVSDRALMQEMMKQYTELYSSEDRIKATYHIIYGVARRSKL